MIHDKRRCGYLSTADRDYHERWGDEREKRYSFRVGYLRGYKLGRNNNYDEYGDVSEYREGLTGYLGWMVSEMTIATLLRRDSKTAGTMAAADANKSVGAGQ